MMIITDLTPGLLAQNGHTLLRVSNVYDGFATFCVELPIPPRPTVIILREDQIWERLTPPTEAILQRSNEAWEAALKIGA